MKRKCIFCNSPLSRYENKKYLPLECLPCKGSDQSSACMFMSGGRRGWFVINGYALLVEPKELILFHYDQSNSYSGWTHLSSIKDQSINLKLITAEIVENKINIMKAFG